MKKLLYVFLLIFLSCSDNTRNPICVEYQINIQELEQEIDKLFKENGKLKEQLENCEAYLKSSEVDTH